MASTASRSIDGTPSDILEQGAFCPILHQSAQCSELCLPRHALDVEGAFYVLEELQKSSRGDSRRCGRFGRMRAVAISWSAWTLATGLLAVAAQSPPARKPIDVSKLGPQVGERVPDFNLKDQNGKSWTLQSVMGSKGAMLVFFRSADW